MKLAGPVLASLLLLMPFPLASQSNPDAGETPSSVETTDGQQAAPEEILAAFKRLVGRGETRARLGLPLEHFWRRTGDLRMALYATDIGTAEPQLSAAAAAFVDATGLKFPIVEAGPVPQEVDDVAELAPEADLVVLVGSRLRIAELAATNHFDQGMLARFEMGTWPFVFFFEQDQRRRGIVLLADDEPARAREASYILAIVWGLGGFALGPELTGLVGDPEAGPSLTPLGEAVFRLFYDDGLNVGMPLGDAVQRAATLLPQ